MWRSELHTSMNIKGFTSAGDDSVIVVQMEEQCLVKVFNHVSQRVTSDAQCITTVEHWICI